MPSKIYGDFRGGINRDVSPELMGENELERALNVEIGASGGLRKRKGTEKFNNASYNAQVEQIIEWVRRDGTTILLAVVGDQLVRLQPDGTQVNLKQISTAKLPYVIVQDNLFFIDSNEYYVYDGNKITHARPKIELVNRNGAFQVGEKIKGTKIVDQETVETGTAMIDLIEGEYLGVSDVLGKFELEDTITGETSGATATINYLEPGVDEENSLSDIKKCKFIIRHPKSFRVFFAGNPEDISAVYFSEYNDPVFVRGSSRVYPSTSEGRAMGFKMLMDALIVFYRYGAWVWRGVDPTSDAIWEKLPTSQGTVSEETIQLTTDSLTSLAPGGLFIMTPSIIGIPMNMEAGKNFIQNIAQNRVSNLLKQITYPTKATAVFDSENEVYLLAYCDDNSGRNNKVLMFDFKTGGFAVHSLRVNDFCVRQNGEILIAAENYILRLNHGYSDIWSDGAEHPIEFDVLTKQFSLDMPFEHKKVERLTLSFRNFGAIHELLVQLIADGTVKKEFTIRGDSTISDLVIHREKVSVVGKRFQVRICNSQFSEVEIYAIGFEFSVVPTVGERL